MSQAGRVDDTTLLGGEEEEEFSHAEQQAVDKLQSPNLILFLSQT